MPSDGSEASGNTVLGTILGHPDKGSKRLKGQDNTDTDSEEAQEPGYKRPKQTDGVSPESGDEENPRDEPVEDNSSCPLVTHFKRNPNREWFAVKEIARLTFYASVTVLSHIDVDYGEVVPDSELGDEELPSLVDDDHCDTAPTLADDEDKKGGESPLFDVGKKLIFGGPGSVTSVTDPNSKSEEDSENPSQAQTPIHQSRKLNTSPFLEELKLAVDAAAAQPRAKHLDESGDRGRTLANAIQDAPRVLGCSLDSESEPAESSGELIPYHLYRLGDEPEGRSHVLEGSSPSRCLKEHGQEHDGGYRLEYSQDNTFGPIQVVNTPRHMRVRPHPFSPTSEKSRSAGRKLVLKREV